VAVWFGGSGFTRQELVASKPSGVGDVLPTGVAPFPRFRGRAAPLDPSRLLADRVAVNLSFGWRQGPVPRPAVSAPERHRVETLSPGYRSAPAL